MDNTLFKEYEQWCVENKKDPLKEESVTEFRVYKAQQEAKKDEDSKTQRREELANKQEEIFKAMCGYVGVKAKYDEDIMFEGLDAMFRAAVMAATVCNKKKEVSKVMDKLLG